ncbi:threonylcarbamoyl-AMP synthase [Microbacteriaceae bacterium VKM Ac-2855]|nr:threonylcarbamoyl-AMP synthase [Microbacteriaceae bacterium VKM Ac-2855]
MARIYDCSVDTELLTGTRLARTALARGELVVLPTDTVYGIAANAFDAAAVQRLLDAKGRTRQAPPPVLIPDLATLDALAENVPEPVRALAKAFWPGGLTIILHAMPSLVWDLGETEGTVALRMPNNAITLELLAETGPLAVSSANKTGQPSATSAQEAESALGDSVEVYLDGGAVGYADREPTASESSTIVDATTLSFPGGWLRIVRQGVVSEAQLREVVGELLGQPAVPVADDTSAADAPAADASAADAPAADASVDTVSDEPVLDEPVVEQDGAAPAWLTSARAESEAAADRSSVGDSAGPAEARRSSDSAPRE